jgi:hypothetical protein
MNVTRLVAAKPWSELERNKKFEDVPLEKAMADLAKHENDRAKMNEESDSDRLVAAAESVARAAQKSSREHKGDAAVVKALDELAKLAVKRVKEIEAEDAQWKKAAAASKEKEEEDEKDEDDSDDGEDAPVDVALVRALMRKLPRETLPFAFGVVGSQGPRHLALHRKRAGAALARQLKTAGCKKVTFGTASAQGPTLLLSIEGPPLSGLKQQVKQYLADNKPMPCKSVQILKGGEGSEDEDDKRPRARTEKQVTTDEDGDMVVNL